MEVKKIKDQIRLNSLVDTTGRISELKDKFVGIILNVAQNNKKIENIKEKLIDKENGKRSFNTHVFDIPEEVIENWGISNVHKHKMFDIGRWEHSSSSKHHF